MIMIIVIPVDNDVNGVDSFKVSIDDKYSDIDGDVSGNEPYND
jgi:hypothetical protein